MAVLTPRAGSRKTFFAAMDSAAYKKTLLVHALQLGGNPPISSSRQKWNYVSSARFCIGVMPPSAMFGRSWL